MLRSGVTVKACRRAESLLRLTLVAVKAPSEAPNDLAASAVNLVKEACASVDDISSGPIAILLGVATGHRGQLLGARRIAAAAELGISAEHLRKDRESGLLEAVADELYAMDSAYRLRHKHRERAEREPETSALGIDWLAQHRNYRRIWTPVTALRADTLVLAGYLRELESEQKRPRTTVNLEAYGADSASLTDFDGWHRISERAMNLCWRLAQFTWELDRFVEREGGLWLLADAESELRAADAMYRLKLHLPFGEVDESVLRLLLTEARDHELDPFEDLMLADDRWPIFRDVWLGWVQAYIEQDGGGSAAPTEPGVRSRESGPSGIERVTTGAERSACGRWLAAGEEFIQLVDEDWYRVADWYRQSDSPATRKRSAIVSTAGRDEASSSGTGVPGTSQPGPLDIPSDEQRLGPLGPRTDAVT